MKNILDLTSDQLRKAAQIKEQIAQLEKQLEAMVGQAAPSKPGRKGRGSKAVTAKPVKRRKMSAAGRKRISEMAKARWAKVKKAGGTSLAAKTAKKG